MNLPRSIISTMYSYTLLEQMSWGWAEIMPHSEAVFLQITTQSLMGQQLFCLTGDQA